MAEEQFSDALLQQLSDDGLITVDQASEVLDEHERTGKPVREVLIDMDIIGEDELLDVVARQLGSEVIRLRDLDLTADVVKSIPASVARMYSVVPIEVGTSSVKLATFDLLSPEVVDELMFVLTKDISFVVAREDDIKTYLNRYYGDESESVSDMLSALESELKDAGDLIEAAKKGEDINQIEQAASSTPVVFLIIMPKRTPTAARSKCTR